VTGDRITITVPWDRSVVVSTIFLLHISQASGPCVVLYYTQSPLECFEDRSACLEKESS
jgi:hypothetical protein